MNTTLRSCALGLGGFLGIISAASADTGPANLLRNGSFEYEGAVAHAAGAYYWMLNDPDTMGDSWGGAARESWRAKTGFFVGTIRGVWANASDTGGWWQDSPATPGKTYRFHGWFFADASWSADEQLLKLEFRDADNTRIIEEAALPLRDIPDTWAERTLSAQAPEGTAYVRLVVYASGTGREGALQFDDFTLVEE